MDLLGPKFAQIYGQGEVPMTITVLPKALMPTGHGRAGARSWARSDHRGSMSTCALPMRSDRDLPTGEVGEILVRGEVVMKGYWNNADATAETLRGGWLHTGDIGAFDAEGFLTLKDRSKDMIISGGSNIYPREVEEVLLRHPAVLEVLGDRTPASRLGRGGRRLCRAPAATNCIGGRTGRALPVRDRAFQTAARICFPRRAAQKQLRQSA